MAYCQTALATGTLALAIASSPVRAEEIQREVVSLADIVVTAQKRRESIMDVPISITAVDGEVLKRRNINSLQALRNIDPSFTYNTYFSPTASAGAIRGVGTTQTFSAIEQSVATVVDGVTLADPSAVNILGDIDRIEILRGPQGMLFGKNASAGVVSITTRLPEFTSFSGSAGASIGTRAERIMNGVVNLPVSDKVAFRFAGGMNRVDGALDRIRDGKDVDRVDQWGIRGKARIKPVDDLDIVLSADYAKSNHYCCVASSWRDVTPGTPAAFDLLASGVVPGPNNTQTNEDHDPDGGAQVLNASLTISYDVNDHVVTAISGYQHSKSFIDVDIDQTGIDLLTGYSESRSESLSQEIRLASPKGQLFDYVAGLYYYTADVEVPFDTSFGSAFVSILEMQAGLPPSSLPTFTQRNRPHVKSKSAAAFLQGNFHLTDELTLLTGVRFTHDRTVFDYRSSTTQDVIYCGSSIICFSLSNEKLKSDNISWRVGVQYQWTPEIMLYGTTARGYKGPAFSTATVSGPNADIRVGAEKPLAFEIGMKAKLFDNRVQASFDLFHTKYDNYQAVVTALQASGLYGQGLGNAELTTKGAELSILAAVTRDLQVTFAGSYIDGEYGDFPGVFCYAGQPNPSCALPGNIFNAKGRPLFASPKWNYAFSAIYKREELIGGLTGSFSVDWRWNSKTHFSQNGDPNAVQDSYGILGGDVGIEPEDGLWRLSVYGRNLLGKRFVANIFDASTLGIGGPIAHTQTFGSDSIRRYGIKFEVNF